MPGVIEFVWSAKWVLASIWAIRIWRLKLVGRYPVLFTYLVLFSLFDLLGSWLHGSHVLVWNVRAYDIFWVSFTPVCWALWIAIVFEVYGHMIERYAGVRKLGRLVLYGSLGSLGLLVGVLLYLNPDSILEIHQWKALWLRQEQGINIGIAALVFILLGFKRVFGLSIPRNVQLIFATFGTYFALAACLMVVRTYVGPEFRPIRDMASMLLYVACLAIGVLLFSRTGEAGAEVYRMAGSDADARPAMAARAARHLESFNQRLVKVLGA